MIETKILTARNPRWSNSTKQTIDCDITTNTLKKEVPFTASPNDTERHGRELYYRCLNNEFGPVVEPTSDNTIEAPVSAEPQDEFLSMHKFLDYANAENARGASRSVVIVWGAYLESELIELLKSWFKNRPQEKCPKRFIFEQAIERAFTIGLINETDKEKYHAIRKIRNRAAHDWDFSLDSESVKDNIKLLYETDHDSLIEYHDDLDFLIRLVYSASCGTLAMKLINSKCE